MNDLKKLNDNVSYGIDKDALNELSIKLKLPKKAEKLSDILNGICELISAMPSADDVLTKENPGYYIDISQFDLEYPNVYVEISEEFYNNHKRAVAVFSEPYGTWLNVLYDFRAGDSGSLYDYFISDAVMGSGLIPSWQHGTCIIFGNCYFSTDDNDWSWDDGGTCFMIYKGDNGKYYAALMES